MLLDLPQTTIQQGMGFELREYSENSEIKTDMDLQ